MKGVSNVQTHPMDFEEILVSDFAHSSWAIGKDETVGSIDSQDPQQPLILDLI